MSAEVVSVVERRFAFWPKLLDHLQSRNLPATPLPAPKEGNESLLLEGQKRWYRLFVRLMPSTGRVEVGIHLPATNQHFGDASAYLYRNGEALGAVMEGDLQVSPSRESYSRHYIELRRQEFRRIMLEERATDFAMSWIGDKISRAQEFIGAHRDFLDAKRLAQTDEHIRTLVESLPLPDPNYAASERPAPVVVPALETPLLPEELPNSDNLYEGGKTQITVNAYERNRAAREICLLYWGTVCAVCNLDLAERYGEVARGLVHVHHLIKISDIAEQYQVDPVADLRPVCPNCHAVIHRRSEPYTIDEVRQFLASAPIAQASK